MTLILSVFILIPLVIEGLGAFSQTTYLSYYYFILPLCLLIFFLIKKKPIRFPTVASICFILFLIFSLISSLNFSVDKQVSFEWWLFYLASFLIFIFFYNFKSEAEKIIKSVVITATTIFITAFLLKIFFPNLFFIKNLPVHGSNLFFSFYTYNHNHLGDFLGLSLIFILVGLVNKPTSKTSLILFFALITPFLYSFSRSAYLSILLVLGYFVMRFRNRHMIVISSIASFFVIVFFFLIVSPYGKLFNLPQKDLLNGRVSYWQQGIKAIKEKSIFGFGMGNFGYASEEYRSNYQGYSSTSHNILIEIIVENGLLAAIPLIIFFVLVLSSTWKKRSAFSLLFLYLFLIFQTDYIYQIYSVMVLFMVLAAIIYEEKNDVESTIIFGIFLFFLYFALQMILISNIFIKNSQFELAIKSYPFNKLAYPSLIQKRLQENNPIGATITANQYEAIAPDDENVLRTLAETYSILGNKKKALSYFKKMYKNNYLVGFPIVKIIYQLEKEVTTSQQADVFIQQAFFNYRNAVPYWYRTKKLKGQMNFFCQQYKKENICEKIKWW